MPCDRTYMQRIPLLIIASLIVIMCMLCQDNASSLKAQLDQQKGMVDNLVSNTRVSPNVTYLLQNSLLVLFFTLTFGCSSGCMFNISARLLVSSFFVELDGLLVSFLLEKMSLVKPL